MVSHPIGTRVAYKPVRGNVLGLPAGAEGTVTGAPHPCGAFLCPCNTVGQDVDWDKYPAASGEFDTRCLIPIIEQKKPECVAIEEVAKSIGWKIPETVT